MGQSCDLRLDLSRLQFSKLTPPPLLGCDLRLDLSRLQSDAFEELYATVVICG